MYSRLNAQAYMLVMTEMKWLWQYNSNKVASQKLKENLAIINSE